MRRPTPTRRGSPLGWGRHSSANSDAAEPEGSQVTSTVPDKVATMAEIQRALKPSGRIQIADIVVHHEVPQDAKDDIDLWSG